MQLYIIVVSVLEKAPYNLSPVTRHADHEALQPAAEFMPRTYPLPDNEVTFPMATALYRSGTNHDHDQVPHLQLRNPGVPAIVNLPLYAGPEARYCPAGAYKCPPSTS